jgi:hypothetical protein
LTFSAGLHELVTDPRLVGMNYDLFLLPAQDDVAPSWADDVATELLAQPEVEAASAGTLWIQGLRLGDRGIPTFVVTYRADPRAVTPVVVDGRAPTAEYEILVHPHLLAELGEIGDTIPVSISVGGDERTEPRENTRDYTIVGTGVNAVDQGFKSTSAMTFEGLLRLIGDAAPPGSIVPHSVSARFRPGIDPVEAAARLQRDGVIDADTPLEGFDSVARDFVGLDLDGADRVPRLLAALFGTLAVAVLAIMITDRVRAWRERLAIHRALGLTAWQIRAAVGAAALLTTGGALVVGLPAGVIVGVSLWSRHAENLGAVSEPTVPWVAIGVLLAAASALALLVSLRPAWVASSHRDAGSLRAE